MLSTEDDAAQDDSNVDQPAQSRDEDRLEIAERLASSDDELTEDDLDHNLSDAPANHSQEAILDTAGNPLGKSLQQEKINTPVQAVVQERPNKYHGPPSTWRSWTASERQLATSLDQLQASNLSIHLYNFYSLKRNNDEIHLLQGDRSQDLDARTAHHRKSWLPIRTWTAWPMIPDLVPRASDAMEWSAETYDILGVRRQALRPSETLQDLLIAQACKKAKESFLEREWDDDGPHSSDSSSSSMSESSSQVSPLAGDSIDPHNAAPVVLEDDERARSILQPSINNILAKLDTLLMGLHHARNSYATFDTEAIPDCDSDVANPGGKKRKRTSSRNGSTRRSRRRQRSSTGMPAHSSDNEEATPASQRNRSRRRQRSTSVKDMGFGLRDWSDIIGVASMCGWDPDVIARATARCSDLFGEGIIFRTFDEGQRDYRETKYKPGIVSSNDLQRAQEGSSQDNRSSGNPGVEKVGAVHVDGFLQPIERQKSWRTRKTGLSDKRVKNH
ncbi:MAG: hypothetical protein Q9220_006550 [cf. Caloplaca sp. 1 TL-2023]